jgi:hypothetical protein
MIGFMMLKVASLIAFINALFFIVSQIHGGESIEYVKYAHEAKKTFIEEVKKNMVGFVSAVAVACPMM